MWVYKYFTTTDITQPEHIDISTTVMVLRVCVFCGLIGLSLMFMLGYRYVGCCKIFVNHIIGHVSPGVWCLWLVLKCLVVPISAVCRARAFCLGRLWAASVFCLA